MTKFVLALTAILLLVSCKKDVLLTQDQSDTSIQSKWFVKTVGSWWVYDWIEVDSMGDIYNLNIRDSVYIIGDTIIDGIDYIVLAGTNFGQFQYRYLRDSSNYILEKGLGVIYNQNSNKYSSSYGNFALTQLFESRIVTGSESVLTTVPAGSFKSIKSQIFYKMKDQSRFTNCDSVLMFTNYWVKGLGEIKSQNAHFPGVRANCKIYEKSLTRFHIESN